MTRLLEFTANPFRGIATVPEKLPDDPEEFQSLLHQSLEAWRSEGFLAVWLEVPISKARLVPVAVEAGFAYHHASED